MPSGDHPGRDKSGNYSRDYPLYAFCLFDEGYFRTKPSGPMGRHEGGKLTSGNEQGSNLQVFINLTP
jgi:hypothetical protein